MKLQTLEYFMAVAREGSLSAAAKYLHLSQPALSRQLRELEEELLERINRSGIGPGGLGGTVTALAVNIDSYPTHIAGLPVAVNICCHVNRHATRSL